MDNRDAMQTHAISVINHQYASIASMHVGHGKGVIILVPTYLVPSGRVSSLRQCFTSLGTGGYSLMVSIMTARVYTS